MNAERLQTLEACYREGLLHDVLPFWLKHAPDAEGGGWFFSLDQDGTVLDTDKSIWLTARMVWMLATLAADPLARQAADSAQVQRWQEEAGRGMQFLQQHAFDDDGRMFFLVDRQGRPLRKRRYSFSEAFAAMAFAAWAALHDDEASASRACDLAQAFARAATEPHSPAKVDPGTRPQSGLAQPMMELAVAQALRHALPKHERAMAQSTAMAAAALDAIRHRFMNRELEAVLEVVTPNGEAIDSWDGRTLNPGHAIEAAWFLLEEARAFGDAAGADPNELVADACRILDWSWRRGWDTEYGGLLYFVELHGGPVQEYWHDMKFWWPHNEAIIATLMAYEATGEARYADWHQQVHDWAHQHFADPLQGEWFGYLHRDGSRSNTLKGGHWKGPFHLPRMQWVGWRTCQRLLTSV